MNAETPNTEQTADEARSFPQDNNATLAIREIVTNAITRFIVDGRTDRNRIADLCCCLGQVLTSAMAAGIDGQPELIDEGCDKLFEAIRDGMPEACEKTRMAIGISVILAGIANAAEAAEAKAAAEQPAADVAAAPMTEAAE
jgi:hypothetical protein